MNHINSLSSAKHIVQKIPVTKTNRSAFTHLALCWHQCADLKFRQTLDNSERQQFWSSRHITRLIARSLRSRSHKKRFSSMYVTFDPNTKTIHAIALTKQHTLKTTVGDTLGKYLQIGLIATNPINIRALCNLKESNRIKGAASSLIRNLHGSCSSMKYD